MSLTVDTGLIGLVWVLGLGAVTISLSLIIFDLIRPRIRDVYDRRRRAWSHDRMGYPLDDGRYDAPPQPSFAPYRWIPYVWKISDHDVRQSHGTDTVMVLRFYRVMAKVFGVLSFFSAAVLIPLFATGANKNLSKKNRLRVFGIRILSFANVPRDDNLRLAFVFTADVLITLYILYNLLREVRYLIRHRREYKSSHHPSNYAVLVQHIPELFESKDDLEKFWESLLPDSIEAIVSIPTCAKIDKCRREYFEAVRHRQRAKAILREAEIDALTKQISASSSSQSEGGTLPAPPVAPQTLLRKYGDSVLKFFQSRSEGNKTDSLSGLPISLQTQTGEAVGDTAQPPLQKNSSLTDKLKVAKALKTWIDPQQNFQHWDAKERDKYEQIEVLRNNGDVFDDWKGTKSALIIFRRKQLAAMAAQSNFADSHLWWSVSPAPDPMAINWGMFGASSRLVFPRRILALALVVCLTVFWVVPTALIQSLANINSLSQTPAFSWLSFVDNLAPEFSGFVQGLLPAMVLEFVMILVPCIMRWFVMLKRLPSKVEVEQEVLQNMIAFLYFSHLIYVVLSGSLLEYSDEIIRNPSNIVKILARSIPQQGTFMMNVVLLATTVQTPLSILQPLRLLKRWLGLRRAWTPRDRELVNASGSLSNHFDSYSLGTIFAVLGIVYSTLTPMLLIFCTLYFLLSYTVTKFKLIFTQTQPWEGFAALHFIALSGVATGLIFKQVTMAGLMGLQKQATLATLEFVLAVLTFAIIVAYHQHVRRVIKYGALSDFATVSSVRLAEIRSQRSLVDGGEEVQTFYRHPSYSPVRTFREEASV